MDQYPKWFLALNFPNVIIPLGTMIFFMFGGVHPFGDVENWFWSFMIYMFCQLFWIAPIALFFASSVAWGWIREKMSLVLCAFGWIINLVAIYFVVSA